MVIGFESPGTLRVWRMSALPDVAVGAAGAAGVSAGRAVNPLIRLRNGPVGLAGAVGGVAAAPGCPFCACARRGSRIPVTAASASHRIEQYLATAPPALGNRLGTAFVRLPQNVRAG